MLVLRQVWLLAVHPRYLLVVLLLATTVVEVAAQEQMQLQTAQVWLSLIHPELSLMVPEVVMVVQLMLKTQLDHRCSSLLSKSKSE